MNKRIVLLGVALALSIVWVGYSYVQSLKPMSTGTASSSPGLTAQMKENSPAADFALKYENGRTHRLTDYKGQIVAMVFYASW